MKLEEYLKKASECPDEKVEINGFMTPRILAEFGIYNNYRILIRGNIENTLDSLDNSQIFTFKKIVDTKSEQAILFNYKPGIIIAQIFEGILHFQETGYEQMEKEYNITLTLHPNQRKNMPDVRLKEAKDYGSKKSTIALLRAITDVTNILIENKLPFCLPGIEKDYSKMFKYDAFDA